MSSSRTKLITLAFLALIPFQASATNVNAFDHGWYTDSGSHSPGNTNIWTGSENSNITRHFMAFDVGSFAGQSITSATLTYNAGNGSYASENTSEHVTWSDYNGNISSLLNGTAGAAAYNDLGTGSTYGTATVTGNPVSPSSPGSGDAMPQIIVNLSASALANIAAAANSADTRFAVGTMITNAVIGTQQKLWWGSFSSAGFLTINSTPVPAPAPFLLVAFGIIALSARNLKLKK